MPNPSELVDRDIRKMRRLGYQDNEWTYGKGGNYAITEIGKANGKKTPIQTFLDNAARIDGESAQKNNPVINLAEMKILT